MHLYSVCSYEQGDKLHAGCGGTCKVNYHLLLSLPFLPVLVVMHVSFCSEAVKMVLCCLAFECPSSCTSMTMLNTKLSAKQTGPSLWTPNLNTKQ